MRSRSLLSFLLLSVSLPVLSAAAAAPNSRPSSMTDWHVAPMVSAGHATPSYCAMATHYTEGPVVTFTRNAAGKGSIAIDFSNAQLEKGKRYAVSLNTGSITQRFTGNAISGTQLVLQTGLNRALDDALAAGNALTVTLDGTDGVFTLAGNTRAFFEFDHCLKALGPVDSSTAIASAQPLRPTAITEEVQQVAQIENIPVIATPLVTQTAAITAPTSILPPVVATQITAPQVAAYEAPQPVTPAPQMAAITAESDSILWDKTVTTTASATPKAQFAEYSANPVSADQDPLPLTNQLKKSEPDAIELAETIPAAGGQAADAKTRLKSSLAQARAEAGEETISEPTPVMTSVPVPSPVVEEPKQVAAPIIQPPVQKPEPKQVALKPVQEKKIAAPAPQQQTTQERQPLASMHQTADAEIQGLLFDNSPTLPGTPAKPYKAPAYTAPVPKAKIVKQEIIKPSAPVLKKEVPLEQIAPETVETPTVEDVIPSLPPILPPPATTLSVEKEVPQKMARNTARSSSVKNIPSELNTMTPSVGHPATQPYTAKTQIQSATVKQQNIGFAPAPAAAVNAWASRKVDATNKESNDAFCLIENSFDNDTKLMIGQRADGYSTLGLNYGIDMLAVGRNYRVTVKVDNEFDEDFTGYAESPRTLIVQMGKKRSFFDTLPNANAMNVAMPGVASSFTLQNLSQELDKFSACLVGLGGNALDAQPVTSRNVNPAAIPVEPVVVSSIDTPQGLSGKPVPIAEAPTTKNNAVLEKMEVTSKTYRPTEEAKENVLWDNKVADKADTKTQEQKELATLDKMPEMKTDAKTAPVVTAQTNDAWKKEIRAFLLDSGVQGKISVNDDTAQWSDGNIKGTATSSQGDVLDAADAALTTAEKSCAGEFTSQMGVPESYGETMAQPMESKCVGKDGSAHVSTWLVRQEPNGAVTSVQMEAPRDSRGRAFQMREKMLSVLKKSTMTSTSQNEIDQNKSS